MVSGIEFGLGVASRVAAMPIALGRRWARHGSAASEVDVPTSRWSLPLVSKVILDDLFMLSELSLNRLVSSEHRKRLEVEIGDSIELFAERGWFSDPAAYHQTPHAIGDHQWSEASVGWMKYRHLRFASGYEPHAGEPGRERWLGYEENRTAHAWLLEHPGKPRPWLVCIPGYRMGQPLVDFVGFRARWLHRELGLNLAFPVLPLHGPRKHGWRGGDGFLLGDFIDTLHAQTQALWDVRRLVGFLEDRGAPAIGAYGISLGGYTAAMLASFEANLDCVIAGIPAADFVGLARDHLPYFMRAVGGEKDIPFEDLGELFGVVSPLNMQPRVPAEKCFLFAGTNDGLAAPNQARDLWNHWGQPRIDWYEGSHLSFLWEPRVQTLLTEALGSTGLIQPESD